VFANGFLCHQNAKIIRYTYIAAADYSFYNHIVDQVAVMAFFIIIQIIEGDGIESAKIIIGDFNYLFIASGQIPLPAALYKEKDKSGST